MEEQADHHQPSEVDGGSMSSLDSLPPQRRQDADMQVTEDAQESGHERRQIVLTGRSLLESECVPDAVVAEPPARALISPLRSASHQGDV